MDEARQRELVEKIAKKFGLSLVILFGSKARAKTREDSDTDVALRGKHTLSMEERIELIGEFERAFQEVDLVDIRKADPLLLACIAKDGKALYEAQPLEFAEFKLFAINQYRDFRPFLDVAKRKLQKSLAEEMDS